MLKGLFLVIVVVFFFVLLLQMVFSWFFSKLQGNWLYANCINHHRLEHFGFFDVFSGVSVDDGC